MITGAQIRAARALLGWSQQQLAAKAIISETALLKLETGQADTRTSTLIKVRRALEDAGVEFVNRPDGRIDVLFVERRSVMGRRSPLPKTGEADPDPNMSPEEYVASHRWTKEFLDKGVTQSQLDGLYFHPNSLELPFNLWSVRAGHAGFPDNAISFAKRYCTLKWLILTNPPSSRNTDDAWTYLSVEEADPIFKYAIKDMFGARRFMIFIGRVWEVRRDSVRIAYLGAALSEQRFLENHRV